jgi:hypothetical protein
MQGLGLVHVFAQPGKQDGALGASGSHGSIGTEVRQVGDQEAVCYLGKLIGESSI